jgi:hypothetical protein
MGVACSTKLLLVPSEGGQGAKHARRGRAGMLDLTLPPPPLLNPSISHRFAASAKKQRQLEATETSTERCLVQDYTS